MTQSLLKMNKWASERIKKNPAQTDEPRLVFFFIYFIQNYMYNFRWSFYNINTDVLLKID